MRMGSKLVDDGHYIFDDEQRAEFLSKEPTAEQFMRPLVGSVEFINSIKRWILRLDDVPPNILRTMPRVMDRIAAVRTYRSASRKKKTRELADTPTLFEVTTIPERSFLAVPKVSSERRDYVPIGWLCPPTLPSQLVQVILDADLWDFAIVTSRMHMAWLRFIGGRLKSDYQYSIGLVYNAFPWPTADGGLGKQSKSSRKPYSTPALHIPVRRSPISTIPTRCPPICARRIRRSTRRWNGSTARDHF